jgi:hypothetical protein
MVMHMHQEPLTASKGINLKVIGLPKIEGIDLLGDSTSKAIADFQKFGESISKAISPNIQAMERIIAGHNQSIKNLLGYLSSPRTRFELQIYRKAHKINPLVALFNEGSARLIRLLESLFSRLATFLFSFFPVYRLNKSDQRKQLMESRGLALTGAPNYNPISGNLLTSRLSLGIA